VNYTHVFTDPFVFFYSKTLSANILSVAISYPISGFTSHLKEIFIKSPHIHLLKRVNATALIYFALAGF
jgi:hypothetical protein